MPPSLETKGTRRCSANLHTLEAELSTSALLLSSPTASRFRDGAFTHLSLEIGTGSPPGPLPSPQHFPIQSTVLLLLPPVPRLGAGAALGHLPAPLPSGFRLDGGHDQETAEGSREKTGCALPVARGRAALLQLGSTRGLASLGKAKPCLFTPSCSGVVRASCNGLSACFLNATLTSVGGPLAAPL